jgi:AAA15 family ATPase/GTPase
MPAPAPCPYFYQKTTAMQNAITTLRIQNFKSIKDVEMKPRRVNIIIGEPNVGKSNILEALSLLGGMFFDGPKFMEGQIRCESIRNLFYDSEALIS